MININQQIENYYTNSYTKCLKNSGSRINVRSQKDGFNLLRGFTRRFNNLEGDVYQNCSGNWLVWINPKVTL